MTAIRGSISITTVDDGSTYNGYLACITGVPFQYYKEGLPIASSDWTTPANQPVFMPVIIAGGSEVQHTLTSISWHLDSMTGAALEEGTDYDLTAPTGLVGPKLKITNNVLSIGASRMLYMQATANIDGVATVVSAWISLEFKEASGDISDLILTMTNNGVCKNLSGAIPAVDGIVITAKVYKGGVEQSGYTFAWYAYTANDSDADNTDDWQLLTHANAAGNGYPGIVTGPASASSPMPQIYAGQIWIPKTAIASTEKIKCVATKSGATTETSYCTLYDLSDPYIIDFTTTSGRTNINSKNPTLDITGTVKQLAATITPADDFTWTVQSTDGEAVTHSESGTKNAVLQLLYANTKGRGTLLIIAETSV